MSIDHVPGRLQPVELGGGEANGVADFTVLVDYAHTDDALQNVCSALKPLASQRDGRLIVVFGCGGDRDRTKRPRMAHVVEEWADLAVVTSDNPRTEDPSAIIQDIMDGFSPEQIEHVRVEADRSKAIGEAIRLADAGDVVLIAGKGHETYQIIGAQKLPFDDAAVALEAMKQRGGLTG
jgi:UDP-N-acetylmuramoyl-L-alanyl-D-glutamate--2,6-diaminopimelate ligase